MKKYTNKILIITAIVVVLAMVIGNTIEFQTGYRSGKITYKQVNPDTVSVIALDDLDAYVDSAKTCQGESLQKDETSSENEPETSNQ